MPRVTREQFLAAAINLVGTPYIYGGRGAIENEAGVDCSGLVALAFWNAGDRETGGLFAAMSAQGMMVAGGDPLPHDPKTGRSRSEVDLAFYGITRPDGSAHASHVVITLQRDGEGPVLSASGGSSEVDTLQEAHEKDAKVKAFASPGYRKDLIGFRSLSKYFK
jgi:cell wall-associated NlpC family hydrolase